MFSNVLHNFCNMTTRTPKVKLFLKLQDGSTTVQKPAQEVIRRIIHGYEEVEIDGFRYKRRRQTIEPQSPAIDENTIPTIGAPELAGNKPQVPMTPLMAPGFSLASQIAVRRYLREHLSLLSEDAPPSEVLTAIAASVGESVLDGCRDERVANALQTVLQDFLIKLRMESGSSGAPQCSFVSPEDQTGDGENMVNRELYAADLQARKAGLRARLQRYKQEEKEWHELLDSVRQDENVGLDDAKRSSDGALNPACDPPSSSASPPNEPEVVTTLRALRSSLHCSLAMQVDNMGMLVGDMTDLVADATAAARTAQSQVHRERFRAFAHMDSPARLIKALAHGPVPPALSMV